MIASVDSSRDFDVYLENQEVLDIANKTIQGVLIRINKPQQQGRIHVCTDNSRRNQNGYGIGIEDEWFFSEPEGEVRLFVGDYYYGRLLESGSTGTRYGHAGSKINLYDRSTLDNITEIDIEHLEFYRDNQEKLKERLG